MTDNSLQSTIRGPMVAVVTHLILLHIVATTLTHAAEPIDIGSRRQLFVDSHLIESMKDARQALHHPVRREIAIKSDNPWEKGGVSFMVTFKDGNKFRAWYRSGTDSGGTAYAESEDGIHWEKPKLGIIDFKGSSDNNLVWNDKAAGNMAPFKDGNPNVKPDEKYKAVVRGTSGNELYTLVSPDGLRWKYSPKEPVFTKSRFDTHNIAFWDDVTQQYCIYTRGVRKGGDPGRLRDDRRSATIGKTRCLWCVF